MCVVVKQSERVRTYLSTLAGTLFVKLCGGRRTHMRSWEFCLSDQRVSPFVWETSGPLPTSLGKPADLPLCLSDERISFLRLSYQRISAFSPNLRTLYCLFKSHVDIWISSSPHVFFCLWLVIGTYTLLFFFPVICWSYLPAEKSVTLSIGNKSYSLSCETTLLILSCDRIESVKFIVASYASILHHMWLLEVDIIKLTKIKQT